MMDQLIYCIFSWELEMDQEIEIIGFSAFISVLTEIFGDFISVGSVFSVSFRSSKISVKDDFEVEGEFIFSVG